MATGKVALMSTLPGTYGQANKVPNEALVTAVSSAPFTLLRTDEQSAGSKSVHVAAVGSAPFGPVADGS